MELDPLEDLPPPPPQHITSDSSKPSSFTYTARDMKDVLSVLQK